MGKTVNVSTSEYKLPITINYTCADCGKEVTKSEDLFVGGSITGLSPEDAKKALSSTLPPDTVDQLRHIADYGKKHVFLQPYDPLAPRNQFHKAIVFRCPHCNLVQVPNAGGKPSFIAGRGMTLPTILTYVVVIGWFIGMGIVLFQSSVNPMALLIVTLAAIACGVGLFIWNKLLKKRAFSDPAYMKKQYEAVLNPAVYVDFTPYGLEKIVMNSEK
ncbi:MAG: hypothetical protein IK020_07510 [Clostridiales bacterium]|nr:hypothetical protein [Clostridiales bacterium]